MQRYLCGPCYVYRSWQKRELIEDFGLFNKSRAKQFLHEQIGSFADIEREYISFFFLCLALFLLRFILIDLKLISINMGKSARLLTLHKNIYSFALYGCFLGRSLSLSVFCLLSLTSKFLRFSSSSFCISFFYIYISFSLSFSHSLSTHT